jgi:hypothetical protein
VVVIDKTDAQLQYAARGGNGNLAAVKVLRAMPEIDHDHIFLLGYSYGAISSLFATDATMHSIRLGANRSTISGATSSST